MESQQTENHSLIKILLLFILFLAGCQNLNIHISKSEEALKAEEFLESLQNQDYSKANTYFAQTAKDDTGIYALVQELNMETDNADRLKQQVDKVLLEYCLQSFEYTSQKDNRIYFQAYGILPSQIMEEGLQSLLDQQIQGYYEQNERSLYLLWQVYGQQDYEEKVSKDLAELCASLIQTKLQSIDPSSFTLSIELDDALQIVQISSAQPAD